MKPFGIVLLFALASEGATPVLTRSYDNGRTGANTTENTLTSANVASRGLKRLKSLDIPDDPRIEAQPLYVPSITMKDGKSHNVLFVCSMGNMVYAFDADAPQGQDQIWRVSVGQPYAPPLDPKHAPKGRLGDMFGINILWGILSTPVIDMEAQGGPAMYLVNWIILTPGKPVLRLHALRLRDGQEFQTALPVTASMKNAEGATVTLRENQKQRAALLLVPLHGQNKKLFVSTAGGEAPGAPNGWVVGYDVNGWRPIDAWVSTPNSFGGGIWQAAQGPSADENGNIYLMTGNGGYVKNKDNTLTDFINKGDRAESFVKLNFAASQGVQKLVAVDWFTPFRDVDRVDAYKDQDLGSGAPILPPGFGLVLGAGKDGVLYVMDRNNLGKTVHDFTRLKAPPIFFTYFPGPQFSATGNLDFTTPGLKTHHLHGSPVFWNSPDSGGMLFDWGENESLRAWLIDASGKVTFSAKSAEIASAALANPSVKGEGGMPGGMLTLTANGSQKNSGVIWATTPLTGNANSDVVEGIVRAYDAVALDSNNNNDGTRRLKLLWDNSRLPDTDLAKHFAFSKFCTPFVSDGKLVVTTYGSWPDKAGNHGRVDIYTLK